MADHKHIIQFIRRAEGAYGNDPLDAGGETVWGITWLTWKSFFGDTHDRFLKMTDDDWGSIFKKLFWDKTLGDQIESQRVADMIVDWVWNSGKHYPEMYVQDILIHAFGQHITEDGNFGPATIASINGVDEQQLYDDLIAKRLWYFDQCVISHPTNKKFINGWRNRVNHLIEFEKSGKLV